MIKINLEKAVEMGEYDPGYLSGFVEWHNLTKNMQWQYIRRGIQNRRRLLRLNYAEIFNQLDFSKKPELANALGNIQKQIEELQKEEERLQVEYSTI